MYLIDEEGILETRDVNARFVNSKPEAIEAIYIILIGMVLPSVEPFISLFILSGEKNETPIENILTF